MAPIEDFQSRDLAWISDFVMQQMVIMLRPMMDHLQETDAACDYSHRMVQRLSMDISEVRGDLERTNKYLAILRQGLGVQNEGKCVLQRSLEGSVRTVKRLDEQMESMLSVMRGVEDSISQLAQDARAEKGKHEDLTKQVVLSANNLDDLQSKVERLASESHAIKDDFLSTEARMKILEGSVRTVKRLDEQMESMLSVMRGVEDSISQLAQDARAEKGKHEDLTKQVVLSANNLDDLQSKVERLSTEARMEIWQKELGELRRGQLGVVEIWQKELRELRRGQLGVVTKLEDKVGRPPPSSQGCRAAATDAVRVDPWPQKKSFAASVDACAERPCARRVWVCLPRRPPSSPEPGAPGRKLP